jgi:O-antigen/teichoic acid export membrane protein
MNLQILTLNWDAKRFRKLVSFGGAVLGGSIISMLFSPFNKLMLSRYTGVATVPIYEIAFTASMQVRGLFEAGLRPLMPEISRLNGITTQEARYRIIHIYRRAMRLIMSAGTPVYVAMALLTSVLLKLWLGDRFVDTLPSAFRIMLIGSFIGLFAVPAYYTLMGMGYIRYNLGAHIVQAGVNLIITLCVLIISRVTITTIVGAATTAMVAVSLYLLLQMRSVFQRFGPGPSRMSELW